MDAVSNKYQVEAYLLNLDNPRRVRMTHYAKMEKIADDALALVSGGKGSLEVFAKWTKS